MRKVRGRAQRLPSHEFFQLGAIGLLYGLYGVASERQAERRLPHRGDLKDDLRSPYRVTRLSAVKRALHSRGHANNWVIFGPPFL